MSKPGVEKREVFMVGKRVSMRDDDDIERRGQAEKERPAKEAGKVIEAVRVNQDGAMVAGGGSGEARSTPELGSGGGGFQTLVFGANGSQELGGNGVRGIRAVNNTKTLPKKGRRDTGKNITLRIIKTDKEFHIVVGDDALEKGLRELEGMGDLWVRRKVGEGH